MNTKGFTLIEAMVAVTILALAVTGPLFAANRAFVAAEISNNQLIASYLAQEGIEYMRAMRDGAYLYYYNQSDPTASADAWNDFLTGNNSWSIKVCGPSVGLCTLDTYPGVSMGYGIGKSLNLYTSNAPLYIANGVYTQQSGISGAVKTAFTRTIEASVVPTNPNEATATSTVLWNFKGNQYTTVVTDHLTPWQ